MLTLLDVLIGLVVFFLMVSVTASYIVEFIASMLNLRAKGLARFITQSFGEGRRLEMSQWAEAFYQHPVIRGLYTPTMRALGKEGPPSYIAPATFSTALLDLLRHKGCNRAAGEALTLDDVRALLQSGILPSGLAAPLQSALTRGSTELKDLQADLESWFDANMQRASGWYKRHTQAWLFMVALGLAAAFNLDSYYLATRLLQDKALTAAMVETGSAINSGDGSRTLADTEVQFRLTMLSLRSDAHIEDLAKTALTADVVRKLFATNYLNLVDGQRSLEMLEQARSNCASPPAEVVSYRKGVADNPRQTLDPTLDALSWTYLCAPSEPARIALEKHLVARQAIIERQRAEFQAIHDKLPKMRWLGEVQATWHWQAEDWLLAALGWLTTAFMASLGASFWFETLGRLANLRGVGSKPLANPATKPSGQ